MRFDPSFLDKIRDRLPVSQVVGRHVKLKRNGREFTGLSPFKAEKTPSFTVNDQKAFYHCFATGEHGDIFTFLMKIEGLNFPEAVERLAEEAGLELPKQSEAQQQHQKGRERFYELMEKACLYFEAEFRSEAGHHARQYMEQRGVTNDLITSFRIGYAPNNRAALKSHLAQAGFSQSDMIETGMLIGGEDIAVSYDRFRNRVMFPILDMKGRVIAFGGRALDADQPAKYLNSPETPLFHKGWVLFNAAKARQTAFEKKNILVVEGYMDVVALAGGGFHHAVAPLGTALTDNQLKLLWRMAPEPTLCFDGDGAGQKAAWRAAELALAHLTAGHSLRFAFMPEGMDPDDLLRQQGTAAVQEVVDQARPLSEVLWRKTLDGGAWDTPERGAALEKQIQDLVRQIQDPMVRSHYERAMNARLSAYWGASNAAGGAPGRQNSGFQQSGQGRPHQAYGGNNKPRAGGASGFKKGGNKWGNNGRGKNRQGYNQGYGIAAPASESLRQSALLRAGTGGLAPREIILFSLILNHPWLLETYLEEFAELVFKSTALDHLRKVILEIHLGQNPLDREHLHTQLTMRGQSDLLQRIIRARTHKSDKALELDAEKNDVETLWLHSLALHRKLLEMEQELSQAERAYHLEGSEESFNRLREIRLELDNAEGGHLGDGE